MIHEAHLRIPPCRWGVSRSDLVSFRNEVTRSWQGHLHEGSEDREVEPAQRRTWASLRTVGDQMGPSIYEVNEKFLKPVTLAAGGMSWALMKNPEGLQCDIFVSHCWAEGVFEFCSKVLQVWPYQSHALWCCFLANPQNADISTVLGEDPLSSPFARALQHARHFVVIPNHRVSIYTRLWCVFEAHLALDLDLPVTLPTRTSYGSRLYAMAPLILTLLLTDLLWIWFNLWVHAQGHTDWLPQLDKFIMEALPAMTLLGTILARRCPRLYFHVTAVLLGLRSDGHIRLMYTNLERSHFCMFLLATETPRWLVTLANLQYFWHIMNVELLRNEGSLLGFTSVRQATCSNPKDEKRIRNAIKGHEDNIDQMVRSLQAIGKSNKSVKSNLELGLSPIRLREGMLIFELLAAMAFFGKVFAEVFACGPGLDMCADSDFAMEKASITAYSVVGGVSFGAVAIWGEDLIFLADRLFISAMLSVFVHVNMDLLLKPRRPDGEVQRAKTIVFCVLFFFAIGMSVLFYTGIFAKLGGWNERWKPWNWGVGDRNFGNLGYLERRSGGGGGGGGGGGVGHLHLLRRLLSRPRSPMVNFGNSQEERRRENSLCEVLLWRM
eukprot:CAMPEP_0206532492 /NCGR_PEP_ID=MMETSP0325_2-20121206/4414_1 /ASSEMBLY_ACC=CAM_ASM_000347 /TAXON_ID=2866 /ORGANISM="Crypthecodinium cohnii, Strain Seligo" /LENGTH=606 /DNA_ID=CAMNT_0054028979 /DNA_START=91 /DNA_END=1911 /DNA_ORIENTATION=-